MQSAIPARSRRAWILARRQRVALEPRRILAAALLGAVCGGIAIALWMHHAHAGSDAYAYWYGVRAWIGGADPYQIRDQALPWHYPPWMLPLFLPWAVVPWPVAWWLWQAAAVTGMGLTAAWAYRSRPMATAVAAALLSVPIGIALDTGNVILFCAFALWVAQFSGPRVGGFLWAVVAAVKWFPAIFLFLLPHRARIWGLAFATVGVLLSMLTWQWTVELVTSVALTGVPHTNSLASLRMDHLAILWALIPWLWHRSEPGPSPRPAEAGPR